MSCEGCGVTDRRGFLAALALAVPAFALPVKAIAAIISGGDQVAYPVPAADGAYIDRDAQVILVRWQNTGYAFALSCPHQNTALRWREEDKRFQCPKHKSKYRPDGTFIEGRATRGMDRYHIELAEQQLVVDKTRMYKQDVNAAEWQHAFVALGEK
jgi:nitrite reductase/ring-hydroxylating ferredoxin subunit